MSKTKIAPVINTPHNKPVITSRIVGESRIGLQSVYVTGSAARLATMPSTFISLILTPSEAISAFSQRSEKNAFPISLVYDLISEKYILSVSAYLRIIRVPTFSIIGIIAGRSFFIASYPENLSEKTLLSFTSTEHVPLSPTKKSSFGSSSPYRIET